MVAAIIDGKAISQQITEEVRIGVEKLVEKGITPKLATILVGDNPASRVYVKSKIKACKKTGIESEHIDLPEETEEDELLSILRRLNNDKSVTGILVQLPLPDHISEEKIIRTISPEKDVDGFHPINLGLMLSGDLEMAMVPCTPAGIIELLLRSGTKPEGKHAVVIGRSNIVGKPVAALLMQKWRGGNATVTVAHSRTQNLGKITSQADILIAAIGRPEFVTADMVKKGAVVIDVGINRVPIPEEERDKSKKKNRLVGDVAFEEVKEIATQITPVPGGVGPMTIAMLMKNTLKAARVQHGIEMV